MKQMMLLLISVLTIFPFAVSGQITLDKLSKNYQYQETFTSEIVEKFKSKLSTSTMKKGKIHSNNVEAKERIEFLNEDFNTKVFSDTNIVECTDFIVEQNENYIHLGVIEVGFNACGNLEKAYSTVLSSERSNFKLKVLTKFLVLKRSHSLLFIYSETPFKSEIKSFFEEINHFDKVRVPCKG